MQVHVARVSKGLILTDPVSCDTGSFYAAMDLVTVRHDAVKVVVVRGSAPFHTKYFILDGNHRAVVAAIEREPVMLYEICGAQDIDVILRLEQSGDIPPFPHRGFLMGSISLGGLRTQAMQAATHSMPLANAFDRAKELAKELGAAELAERQKITEGYYGHARVFVPKEIRKDDGLSLTPPVAVFPVVSRAALPTLAVPSVSRNTKQRTKGIDSPPQKSSVIGGIDSRKERSSQVARSALAVNRMAAQYGGKNIHCEVWALKIAAFFSDQSPGQEFPCPYSKFAEICDEPTARGPVITAALVRSGVLEYVRVGTVQTGHYFPSGRPETIKITYWRFLLRE